MSVGSPRSAATAAVTSFSGLPTLNSPSVVPPTTSGDRDGSGEVGSAGEVGASGLAGALVAALGEVGGCVAAGGVTPQPVSARARNVAVKSGRAAMAVLQSDSNAVSVL